MRFAPRRKLGRTGFIATRVGAGDLADRSLGLEACARVLGRALDTGINVVDTAPSYEDGFSEEVVGRAVANRRSTTFVIDKIDHLDRPVDEQLESSVQRLGFVPDAFVFHNVSSLAQWEAITRPSGPMAELASEVARGRCHFRGISSHHPDVVRAAILSGQCDVLMFPVGPSVDPRYLELLALAREHDVGTVCFKTFGAGKLVADTAGYGKPLDEAALAASAPKLTVAECVHTTLTHDPDVALLGLSTPEEQDAAFAAAFDFRPLSAEQLDDLQKRAAEALRGKGPSWWDP